MKEWMKAVEFADSAKQQAAFKERERQRIYEHNRKEAEREYHRQFAQAVKDLDCFMHEEMRLATQLLSRLQAYNPHASIKFIEKIKGLTELEERHRKTKSEAMEYYRAKSRIEECEEEMLDWKDEKSGTRRSKAIKELRDEIAEIKRNFDGDIETKCEELSAKEKQLLQQIITLHARTYEDGFSSKGVYGLFVKSNCIWCWQNESGLDYSGIDKINLGNMDVQFTSEGIGKYVLKTLAKDSFCAQFLRKQYRFKQANAAEAVRAFSDFSNPDRWPAKLFPYLRSELNNRAKMLEALTKSFQSS